MEMVVKSGLMGPFFKGSISLAKRMDMECFVLLISVGMKGGLRRIICRGSECISGGMEGSILESGLGIRCRGKEGFNEVMEGDMKGNIGMM